MKKKFVLKCVLGPNEPPKKISRVIFFYLKKTFSKEKSEKKIEKKIVLKCVLGPKEPPKKISRDRFFFDLKKKT